MSTSTKLSELPVGNNVSMNISEGAPENTIVQAPTQQPLALPQQPPYAMPNDMVSEIVSGVRASNGATLLPSRDIPMDTTQLTSDQHMQPNYVPDEHSSDYIKQYDDFTTLAQQQKDIADNDARMESLYESLQLPLLVGVLFFLFQLPFVRKQLFVRVPSLFLRDGQPKMSGFLVLTSLFVGTTYLGQKYLLN
jgi:hypothetical protein